MEILRVWHTPRKRKRGEPKVDLTWYKLDHLSRNTQVPEHTAELSSKVSSIHNKRITKADFPQCLPCGIQPHHDGHILATTSRLSLSVWSLPGASSALALGSGCWTISLQETHHHLDPFQQLSLEFRAVETWPIRHKPNQLAPSLCSLVLFCLFHIHYHAVPSCELWPCYCHVLLLS